MQTFDARQRRIYRARSATFLSTLNSSCSVDELLTLDWAALETLPHWCFLPEKQKRELQLLSGALFLAPMIQRWIDGRRIQSLREVIGDDIYQAVLQYQNASAEIAESGIPTVGACEEHEAPDTTQMLLDAGSAILRGAVQHPVIARLLDDAFGSNDNQTPLSAAIAQPLYTDALFLFDRLYPDGPPAADSPVSEQPA